MTARYEFQADGTVKIRRYEWDDGARLTAVTVGAETSPKVPTAGAIRAEWTYDVSGRRVREITKTRTATATWTTDKDVRYVWDGTGIIQERDTASNAVLTDYYTAGEVQFSPSTLNSQPSTYYYTRDHLGSVRELIDATGTVRARYDYDPYGVRTKLSGDLDTPVGYTGHRYHESSGLHLALFRAYDGELGRWISEDPNGEEGGVNLYGYVGGGVVEMTDALGLEPVLSGAGTLAQFLNEMNTSPSKIGTKTGSAACSALNSLGLSSGLPPKPITTPYFNEKKGRYIYTTKGGWIDMVHFLYYAGQAHIYKGIYTNPVGKAMQGGYQQEFFDPIQSKYSYEDLPSDKFGADFGANHFSCSSSQSLSKQIEDYFNSKLGPVAPSLAPNYATPLIMRLLRGSLQAESTRRPPQSYRHDKVLIK